MVGGFFEFGVPNRGTLENEVTPTLLSLDCISPYPGPSYFLELVSVTGMYEKFGWFGFPNSLFDINFSIRLFFFFMYKYI